MQLSEDEIDAFVSGKCMYLAAALHRLCGWELQAVLGEHESGRRMSFELFNAEIAQPAAVQPYVQHAWAVSPGGLCIDIDGAYPRAKNGWDNGIDTCITELTETTLRELTALGCATPFTLEQWNAAVEDALAIAEGYLLPRIESDLR